MGAFSKNIPFILAVLVLGGLQAQLNGVLRSSQASWVEPPREQQLKWDADLFKALSVGFWPAAVDGLWIRVLQDHAVDDVAEGVRAAPFYDLDLATDLDPAYYILSVAGADLLAIIRHDVDGASRLLEKAAHFYHESLSEYPPGFQESYSVQAWNIFLRLGYLAIFEKDDLVQGARYFQKAAHLPGAPEYLKKLEKRIQKKHGLYETGIRLLKFLYQVQKLPSAKEKVARRIRSLQLSYDLVLLNERWEEYVTQRGRGKNELIWREFLAQMGFIPVDAFGGKLYLNDQGKIDSETPREKVLGLK